MVCLVVLGFRENFLRKRTIIIYLFYYYCYLLILLFTFKMTGPTTQRAELAFVLLMEKGQRRPPTPPLSHHFALSEK